MIGSCTTPQPSGSAASACATNEVISASSVGAIGTIRATPASWSSTPTTTIRATAAIRIQRRPIRASPIATTPSASSASTMDSRDQARMVEPAISATAIPNPVTT